MPISVKFSHFIRSPSAPLPCAHTYTYTHVQTEAAFIPEGQEQLLSSTCMQRVIN